MRGGLTAAIALGRKGHRVRLVEQDPTGAVYGVGIIQQSNVVRAMHELGILHGQADDVIARYREWFHDFAVMQEGDWVRITAIRH